MLRVLALGVIATFSLCAQPSPTVGVFMDFDSTPGSVWLSVMQREVADLLKPAGIAVNWRFTAENRGDESYSRLVVLKFTGACRADRVMPAVSEEETYSLGDAKVSHGSVLPFSEVRCNEVRKALAYLAPQASKEQRQKALGVALARVVAHELYHMLARTTAHAAQGLARASHPLPELISSRSMVFRESEWDAIRKGFEDGQTAVRPSAR